MRKAVCSCKCAQVQYRTACEFNQLTEIITLWGSDRMLWPGANVVTNIAQLYNHLITFNFSNDIKPNSFSRTKSINLYARD